MFPTIIVVVQLLSHVWLFATPWTEHTRLPCPSLISRNLLKLMSIELVMPFNHFILSHPLLPCFHSFPASESFPISQLFTSGGQNIGASASASVLPVNIWDWSPLRWTGWISLQSKGLSSIFCKTTVQKHQFFSIDSFISPVFLSDSPLIFWCSVLDAYTLKIAISSWRTDPLLFCNVPLYGSCVKAGSSLLKNLPPNAGDAGSVPGLGRSPGEGNGNPLQYCGLENSKDCIIHGVAKGRTRLNDFHFTSSLLPWEIPWTEEPGRVQSMRLQKCQIQLNN